MLESTHLLRLELELSAKDLPRRSLIALLNKDKPQIHGLMTVTLIEIHSNRQMVVLELMHQLPLESELNAKDLHKEDPEVLLRCNLGMILVIKLEMMPGSMIATQTEM